MFNEIKSDKKIALVYPDYYLVDEKGIIISGILDNNVFHVDIHISFL